MSISSSQHICHEENPNVGEDVGKENLVLCGGALIWSSNCGSRYGGSRKKQYVAANVYVVCSESTCHRDASTSMFITALFMADNL